MTKITLFCRSALLRDQRGVALPLALLGLVLMTLMITAVLVTSSTEVGISGAHQTATQRMYTAESGVQQFVAVEFGKQKPFGDATSGSMSGTVDVAERNTTRKVKVDVWRLLSAPRTDAAGSEVLDADGSSFVDGWFLVDGSPIKADASRDGRTFSEVIRLSATIVSSNLNLNSGLTVLDNLEVGGSSEIIDRSANCADTLGTDNAVTLAAGTTLTTIGNNVQIDGNVHTDTLGSADMSDYILRGNALEDYADIASIRFGPRYGTPSFGSTNPSSSYSRTDPSLGKYNWGCPASMGVSCTGSNADPFYMPVIAIDASAMSGNLVALQGDHGQGTLIILNGHLKITGNFQFKGIILVEGNIEMRGTGGTGGSKIEGAVAALNAVGEGTNEISETSGNAMISFNRCAMKDAAAAMKREAERNPVWQSPAGNPSVGWFEVVR